MTGSSPSGGRASLLSRCEEGIRERGVSMGCARANFLLRRGLLGRKASRRIVESKGMIFLIGATFSCGVWASI